MEICVEKKAGGDGVEKVIKLKKGNGLDFEIIARHNYYGCQATHASTGLIYDYEANSLLEAVEWCESLKEPKINGAKEILDAMERSLDHMLFETEKDKRFARCVNYCIQLLKELL